MICFISYHIIKSLIRLSLTSRACSTFSILLILVDFDIGLYYYVFNIPFGFQIKKIVVNPVNPKDRVYYTMEGMQPMMSQHIIDDEEHSYQWLKTLSNRQVNNGPLKCYLKTLFPNIEFYNFPKVYCKTYWRFSK